MNYGAVVGRFQVPDLHMGHRNLLEQVLERHDGLIVMLGVSPLPPTKDNPLPYSYRKRMIERELEMYGNSVIIKPLYDHPSDAFWSQQLDEKLSYIEGPKVLYGGRDSFIPYYSGTYETVELGSPGSALSGTTIRQALGRQENLHEDPFAGFAHGVVWATQQQYPTVYSTVDVIATYGMRVVLIRKHGMEKYALPGGFADPTTASDEEDAVRELKEETNLDPGTEMVYCGSYMVDDWRYRGESKIRTRLFFTEVETIHGIEAGDDAIEVALFEFNDVAEHLQECHLNLWSNFLIRRSS